MKSPDVLILGAGAAGLAAAKVLSDAGRRVLIVEARDRIGGRIHTLRDSRLGIPIELGAEFIHGRPEATWQTVREAGLVAMDLPFDYQRSQRGRLVELPDVEAELSKILGGLAHLGARDKSFAQYLRDHHSRVAHPEAQKFALSFVQGFDAADPERISAKSLAAEQLGLGDVGDEPQYRLRDGYGALIEYLRNCLHPKRAKIRLRSPVSEVRWRKSKVEVRLSHGGTALRAPRVLVTLPLGILQLPPAAAGSIRFVPEIPDWRDAAMRLAFGPVVKATFRFREPFWENSSDKKLRDASFILDSDAPFPTWWTQRPLRLPVLTAWAGGPKALALAQQSKQKLMTIAVDSLASLLKMRRSRLISLIEHFYFWDWGADPFSRGAYSYVAVGGMSARSKLSKPIEKTLFFAGEAIDTSGQASTVAGALASGRRAARDLLATL